MRNITLVLTALALLLPGPLAAQQSVSVGDLTFRPGDTPRRLVGYGLVIGLDGSGDRSFGTNAGGTITVRSVVNLLRRFNVEVPPERLRLRNVAVVLVTAEVSPYLRTGGRFEVQVASLGDATSLRGGVLWMTPMVTDPNQPPVATAQGPIFLDDTREDRRSQGFGSQVNAGRIAQGGLLEVDPPVDVAGSDLRLIMRTPDLATASHIADAVKAAYGDSAAIVVDPGAIALRLPATETNAPRFLTSVDTLKVNVMAPARIVIDSRQGTVVAGGDVRVGAAVVSHRGITLQVGGTGTPSATPASGLLHVGAESSVQDIAAGLHAVGASAEEIAAIFESLLAAGALRAEVVIR
ncbi:MAG: flagellar basal body P-ring protein FlgI [Gemmatimonadota bacterium]